MIAPHLFFNILNFDFPKEKTKYYFSESPFTDAVKLHYSVLPNCIAELFPDFKPSKQNHIFSSFDLPNKEVKSITLNLKDENLYFVKRALNNRIYKHFRDDLNLIVRKNFINDNQIWVLNKEITNKAFKVYDKFSLKINFNTVSDYPELCIAYDGASKVSNLCADVLIEQHNIAPDNLNYVVYKNSIYRYDRRPEDIQTDSANTFPVLSNTLKQLLAIPSETRNPFENSYIPYLKKLKQFISTYLDNKDFQELIPLRSTEFIPVENRLISGVSDSSNDLIFGDRNIARVPSEGIKKGPFKIPENSTKIQFFFIVHKDDAERAKKLRKQLIEGVTYFSGFSKYVKFPFYTEDGFSIVYANTSNPIEEIEMKLAKKPFKTGVQYFAIYISPINRLDKDEQKHEVYYKVKEVLLKRNIFSQVINNARIDDKNIGFSLSNIAIAILAKLNGIPWQLAAKPSNELIVGIGAFKHMATNVQYIGSAFSFDNTGKFNQFETFQKNEVIELAGSISKSVRDFKKKFGNPSRLIIHFYKTMSEREIEPIETELNKLDLSIPIIIVTINKTESEDIIAFDNRWSGKYMPISGTIIKLGGHKYLLYNSTRYSDLPIGKADGYPFPVKLKIHCKDEKLLFDAALTKELINQVYSFSRIYWKALKQQSLPVTIKYPEMLAQITPHFENGQPPLSTLNNLWFL